MRKTLAGSVHRLPEDDLVSLLVTTPIASDWIGAPLEWEARSINPYQSPFAVLASVAARSARGAWALLGLELPLKTRNALGLPKKPGDIDLLVGSLADGQTLDLAAPVLAIEAGVVRLAHGEQENAELGDERKDAQVAGLGEWPFEFVAVLGSPAFRSLPHQLQADLALRQAEPACSRWTFHGPDSPMAAWVQ